MYGREIQTSCESGCGEVDYAMALARWGRVELLKEKVKQRMNAHYGAKLDKIADLITEVVIERSRKGSELEDKESKLSEALEDLNEEEA